MSIDITIFDLKDFLINNADYNLITKTDYELQTVKMLADTNRLKCESLELTVKRKSDGQQATHLVERFP